MVIWDIKKNLLINLLILIKANQDKLNDKVWCVWCFWMFFSRHVTINCLVCWPSAITACALWPYNGQMWTNSVQKGNNLLLLLFIPAVAVRGCWSLRNSSIIGKSTHFTHIAVSVVSGSLNIHATDNNLCVHMSITCVWGLVIYLSIINWFQLFFRVLITLSVSPIMLILYEPQARKKGFT